MGKEDLIFFADNDPQTASQHCEALDRAGYTVKHCPLNTLTDTINGTLQGLVILNLGSNVQAGLDAQQQLIADGRAWPVIFIADCDQIPSGKLLQSVQEAISQLDARRDIQLRRAGIEQRCTSLTRREKEIMEYVANGVTNQDVHCRSAPAAV